MLEVIGPRAEGEINGPEGGGETWGVRRGGDDIFLGDKRGEDILMFGRISGSGTCLLHSSCDSVFSE